VEWVVGPQDDPSTSQHCTQVLLSCISFDNLSSAVMDDKKPSWRKAISYLLLQTVFRSAAPFSYNAYVTNEGQTTDGHKAVA